MIRGCGPQVQNSSIISTKNNHKIRFAILSQKNIHKIKFITVHTLFYKFNPSTYYGKFFLSDSTHYPTHSPLHDGGRLMIPAHRVLIGTPSVPHYPPRPPALRIRASKRLPPLASLLHVLWTRE